jgi:hypothetical protein
MILSLNPGFEAVWKLPSWRKCNAQSTYRSTRSISPHFCKPSTCAQIEHSLWIRLGFKAPKTGRQVGRWLSRWRGLSLSILGSVFADSAAARSPESVPEKRWVRRTLVCLNLDGDIMWYLFMSNTHIHYLHVPVMSPYTQSHYVQNFTSPHRRLTEALSFRCVSFSYWLGMIGTLLVYVQSIQIFFVRSLASHQRTHPKS